MSLKTKTAVLLAVFLWASAFVGIRAGLTTYSPEGLALMRFMVASLCMGVIYFFLPNRITIKIKDMILLMLIGSVGIGLYNITLNYAELSLPSGVASFIISQSPILTTIFAFIFLGEKLTKLRIFGFIVSFIGIILIAYSETHAGVFNKKMLYILIATLVSAFYSILQKPFLKKYHAIQSTAFIIWGGTLFLMLYTHQLEHDLMQASWNNTLTVLYLGVFPAAIGYLAWAYALSEIPAARAVSFLYFMPFLATMIGWICLGEMPIVLSMIGGAIAIGGVWIVNHSYLPKN